METGTILLVFVLYVIYHTGYTFLINSYSFNLSGKPLEYKHLSSIIFSRTESDKINAMVTTTKDSRTLNNIEKSVDGVNTIGKTLFFNNEKDFIDYVILKYSGCSHRIEPLKINSDNYKEWDSINVEENFIINFLHETIIVNDKNGNKFKVVNNTKGDLELLLEELLTKLEYKDNGVGFKN